MTIKSHEFDKLTGKFGLKTRNSGDRLAWLEYEGKIVVRTRRSNKKGDLPMQNSIRQQLKLTESQLREAIDCTLTFEQYIEILRSKGLI
ncbi:MAG: hypothetical protein ABSG90_02410 [Dehalococcoidia bacterium]|jgi:hypothetical protein